MPTELFEQIQNLVRDGKVRISDHGYGELANDGIKAREIVAGLASAELLEIYPEFPKGPACLLLELDAGGKPIHAVWGIPAGYHQPAVLITAYRPNPALWSVDFKRRISK